LENQAVSRLVILLFHAQLLQSLPITPMHYSNNKLCFYYVGVLHFSCNLKKGDALMMFFLKNTVFTLK